MCALLPALVNSCQPRRGRRLPRERTSLRGRSIPQPSDRNYGTQRREKNAPRFALRPRLVRPKSRYRVAVHQCGLRQPSSLGRKVRTSSPSCPRRSLMPECPTATSPSRRDEHLLSIARNAPRFDNGSYYSADTAAFLEQRNLCAEFPSSWCSPIPSTHRALALGRDFTRIARISQALP